MTVSMKTVAITNIDIRVCTRKSEFSQGEFIHYFIQPEIKIQRHFELTDIEYDQIKGEITRM